VVQKNKKNLKKTVDKMICFIVQYVIV